MKECSVRRTTVELPSHARYCTTRRMETPNTGCAACVRALDDRLTSETGDKQRMIPKGTSLTSVAYDRSLRRICRISQRKMVCSHVRCLPRVGDGVAGRLLVSLVCLASSSLPAANPYLAGSYHIGRPSSSGSRLQLAHHLPLCDSALGSCLAHSFSRRVHKNMSHALLLSSRYLWLLPVTRRIKNIYIYTSGPVTRGFPLLTTSRPLT
ncbi:hypothetical protein F4861DRAFT_292152 [Xylaria intraflava]|nr:hypothetical protein F4861DRAFT_292152 [Xylaria intraflava]